MPVLQLRKTPLLLGGMVRTCNGALLLAIWLLAPRRRWLAVNTDFYGPHFTLASFVGMQQDLLCAMLEQGNTSRKSGI